MATHFVLFLTGKDFYSFQCSCVRMYVISLSIATWN